MIAVLIAVAILFALFALVLVVEGITFYMLGRNDRIDSVERTDEFEKRNK